MARRLKARCTRQFENVFRLTPQPDMLVLPLQWKKTRTIFVNSMSDLFHKELPLAFIRQVFDVMNRCPQHTFQVLTKRPEIAAAYAAEIRWTDNIWMGTSVENALVTHRISSLREISAAVRFLSLEPLIGPLPRLPLDGIDWVIVGGESGPGSRPMREEWVQQIQEQCMEHAVPFFFKQRGGVPNSRTGRMLKGRTWDDMPLSGHVGRRSHGKVRTA